MKGTAVISIAESLPCGVEHTASAAEPNWKGAHLETGRQVAI